MADEATRNAPWWYATRTGERRGPVSYDELRSMFERGGADAQTLIWTAGWPNWAQAWQADGFRDVATPPVVPGPVHHARTIADDVAARMLLPVGRSPWAVAAGYLALFSVLLFPAPLALITGAIAWWDISTHERRTGKTSHGLVRASLGIVLGAVGSVALVWVMVAR